MNLDHTTLKGTLSGILLVLLDQQTDILRTILLAAIGAVVSFVVSKGLHYLQNKCKR